MAVFCTFDTRKFAATLAAAYIVVYIFHHLIYIVSCLHCGGHSISTCNFNMIPKPNEEKNTHQREKNACTWLRERRRHFVDFSLWHRIEFQLICVIMGQLKPVTLKSIRIGNFKYAFNFQSLLRQNRTTTTKKKTKTMFR